jgi:hypothetical protein
MATTPEQIDEYLKKLDWPYSKREENLWDSGYVGQSYRVRFIIRLTERWMYINALLPVKVRPECRPALYEHLLRLNYLLNGVKLYLDNDDDVTMAMEVVVDGLTVDAFETALYAVCTNADRHFVEMIRLATDPTAVSSQKSGEEPAATGAGVDWSGEPSPPPPPESQEPPAAPAG